MAFGVTVAFSIVYFLTTAESANVIKINIIDILKPLGTILIYSILAVGIGVASYALIVEKIGVSNCFLVLVVCTILDFVGYALLYYITHKFFATKEMHSLLVKIIGVMKQKFLKK